MSGRPAPASEVIEVCVSKSTYRVRPAASTTRRSCVSPQTPRVLPERRALARDSVVARSASSDCCACRSCSASEPNWA